MGSEQTNNITPSKAADFSEGTHNELDLPPEYRRYRDEGCELASSCLNCPLPKCIYDEPGGKQRWRKRLRDKEMARLFNSEGEGVKELALMFNVSQRTVQRALKGVKNGRKLSIR